MPKIPQQPVITNQQLPIIYIISEDQVWIVSVVYLRVVSSPQTKSWGLFVEMTVFLKETQNELI
jgi:hypothetical protein